MLTSALLMDRRSKTAVLRRTTAGTRMSLHHLTDIDTGRQSEGDSASFVIKVSGSGYSGNGGVQNRRLGFGRFNINHCHWSSLYKGSPPISSRGCVDCVTNRWLVQFPKQHPAESPVKDNTSRDTALSLYYLLPPVWNTAPFQIPSSMGNLCGKPSKDTDPFAQPGRTLGPAPPQPSKPRASVPKISGGTGSQGKTLGGDTSAEQSDARSAAAKAAEVGEPSDPYDRLAPRFKKYPDTGRLLTML